MENNWERARARVRRRKKESLTISDESTAVRKLSEAVAPSDGDIAAVGDNEIFNQFGFSAHPGINRLLILFIEKRFWSKNSMEILNGMKALRKWKMNH